MGAAEKKSKAEGEALSPAGKTEPAPSMGGSSGGTLAAVGSLALHGALVAGLVFVTSRPATKAPEAVRVQIKEVQKPKPPEVKPPEPPKVEEKKPEPPKEKPKPKPKPPEKKTASERKPEKKPPVKPAPPVQGLSASAVSPNGTGIAAPVGNTLMTEDEGKRLKAEDVQPLTNEDLSADAALIRASIATPQYTDAALDAELEGTYTVEVFVDAAGAVTDAQLPKKIGYGMDEKVMAAARKARFTPRKDKLGKSIPGWTEVKFRLEIPQ